MTYKQFLEKAYPASKRQFDQDLTIASRTYRPIGNYLGYLLWRLGVSANAVSMFRVALVLAAFYLLTLSGDAWLPYRIGAVFMLLLGKIMDCTDGVIARASEKFSKLGELLDSFSDRPVRAGMTLVLLAYYSPYVYLVPYAVFVAWVIHQFGQPLKEFSYSKEGRRGWILEQISYQFLDKRSTAKEDNAKSPAILLVNFVIKIFKCDFTLFVLLPLYIAFFNTPALKGFFYKGNLVLLAAYSAVMVVRFIGGVLEYSRPKSTASTTRED